VPLAGIELHQESLRAGDAFARCGRDLGLAAEDRNPALVRGPGDPAALPAGIAKAIARASFVEERICGACGFSFRS
jgi:hypothetical protein